MINEILHEEIHDKVLLRCIKLEESTQLIKEFHYSTFKSHYLGYTIIGKVIQATYYWPTIFKYVFKVLKECEKCK